MTQNGRAADRRIEVLSREQPARAVVRLGVPLIAGMLIMVLYNLVDTYFIGLMRDDYRLAAVNLAYPVMMISVAVANMTGAGASSLIARSLGAGDTEKAEHTLTAGFVLTAANSLLVAAVGLSCLDGIVAALGAQANTFAYTREYVSVVLCGSLFTMGSYALGQLLRSEGSAKWSVLGMVTGTAVNIALDPLFIFAFGMGVRGAAIATVLGNAAGTAASLFLYASGRTLLRPRMRFLRPTGEILREIFWVGVPATLETLLTSAAYIVNNNLAVAYGELTVAAMGVAQKILSLGSYIYQGFAAGAQPLMGYNYGAKNYRRMLAVLRAGVLVVSGTELCVMLVCGTLAPQLVGLFTDSPEVVATGSRVLRTLMCALPFVGAVSMSRMSFQAMGKPQYAFGITLVRQLALYVPLLLILDRRFGFGGMIWAQPITEAVMMAASVGLLYRTLRAAEFEKETKTMENIRIRPATRADVGAVARIYDEIHTAEESGEATVGWERGVYPTAATAEAAAERGDLFVLEEDGEIRAAAIINLIQVDGYAGAPWEHDVPDDGACVLHTLVVSPSAAGRGLGRRFVAFYEDHARKNGVAELRMDTNARNTRARAMYAALGYREIGAVPTTFNGIPGVELVLLEKYLG